MSSCMPGLCSDPSLVLSLSVAPAITNLRGSLHFFFSLCRHSSVQKQAYVPCSPYLSFVPLGLDPSCLFILQWQVCSPQLKQLSCCWALAVPGKPCHAQPGPPGVYPVPSVALCVGAEAGSGWIWDVLLNSSYFLEAGGECRGEEEHEMSDPAVAI